MKKQDLGKQLFTIPNILTYIRILFIPAIMVCTINKNTYIHWGSFDFPIIALVLMAVAASTDLFDGMIARKFNQTSDLGTLLDPLADKLMQCTTVLALIIAGNVHWAYILIMVLKEGLMVAAGIIMANDSKLIKANMMGKVASVTIDIAIVMSFFHVYWVSLVPKFMPEGLQSAFFSPDWLVLTLGIILTYCAFFNYLKQAIPLLKAVFANKRARKEAAIAASAQKDEVPQEAESCTEEQDTFKGIGAYNIQMSADIFRKVAHKPFKKN